MFDLWNYEWYRRKKYREIENSFIYEIVKKPSVGSPIKLYILDSNTIRFAAKENNSKDIEYCQIINNQVVSFFKRSELLFLDKAI